MDRRRDTKADRGPRLPDGARTGAALFVGSEDSEGVLELLVQLLDDALARHLAGEVTTIAIEVHADHFSVHDDGPGLGRRELSPATLSRARSTNLDRPQRAGQRRGRSLAVINSLSTRLEVLSSHHGAQRRWLFEGFDPVVSGARLGAAEGPGTTVRVWPNPELFSTTRPDLTSLEDRLETLHALCPSLDLRLDGEPPRGARGPAAWVRAELGGREDVTVHSIDARRGSARLELAFAWLPPFGAARCRSFVNLIETPADGSHVEALLDALARANEVSPGMARERCLALVSVSSPNPTLRASPSLRLDDDDLRRWIFDVVEHELLAASS